MPPRAPAQHIQLVPPLAAKPPTSQNILAPPTPPQRSRLRPDSARVGEAQHRVTLGPPAGPPASRTRRDAPGVSGISLPADTRGESLPPVPPSNIAATNPTTTEVQSLEMQHPRPYYKRQNSAELHRRAHVRRRGRASSSPTSECTHTPASPLAQLPRSAPAVSSSYHAFSPRTSRSASPSSNSSKSTKPHLHPIITQNLPSQPKPKIPVEWPTKTRKHPFRATPGVTGDAAVAPAKHPSSSSTSRLTVGVVPMDLPSVPPIPESLKKVNFVDNTESRTGLRSERPATQNMDVIVSSRPMPTVPDSYPPPDFAPEFRRDKGKGKAPITNFRPYRPLPMPPATQEPAPAPTPAPNRVSTSVHALLDPSSTPPSQSHHNLLYSNHVPLDSSGRSNQFDPNSTIPHTRSASLDSISAWSQVSAPETGLPPTRMNTLLNSVRGPRPLVHRKSTKKPVVDPQITQNEKSEFYGLADWTQFDSLLAGSSRTSFSMSFPLEFTPGAEGALLEPAPSRPSLDSTDSESHEKNPRNKLRRADTNAVRQMILQRRDRARLGASGQSQDLSQRFAGMGFGSQVSKKFGFVHLRKSSDESDQSHGSNGTVNGNGIELGKMIAVM